MRYRKREKESRKEKEGLTNRTVKEKEREQRRRDEGKGLKAMEEEKLMKKDRKGGREKEYARNESNTRMKNEEIRKGGLTNSIRMMKG